MLNCLMYKLSYYRFGELKLVHNEPRGYDPARKAIPGVNYKVVYPILEL